MTARKGVARVLVLFGCCELLPLTRGYFGLGYIGLLAVMLALKQLLLQSLPVASGVVTLHQFAGMATLLWLAHRIASEVTSAVATDIPADDPGFWFWWPYGWSRTFPLLWVEPFAALVIVGFALTPDMVRFVPAWVFDVPRETCGIAHPCLGWDSALGMWLVHVLALVPVVALWLNNRWEYADDLVQKTGRDRSARKPPPPQPPVFSVAGSDITLPDEGGYIHGSAKERTRKQRASLRRDA